MGNSESKMSNTSSPSPSSGSGHPTQQHPQPLSAGPSSAKSNNQHTTQQHIPAQPTPAKADPSSRAVPTAALLHQKGPGGKVHVPLRTLSILTQYLAKGRRTTTNESTTTTAEAAATLLPPLIWMGARMLVNAPTGDQLWRTFPTRCNESTRAGGRGAAQPLAPVAMAACGSDLMAVAITVGGEKIVVVDAFTGDCLAAHGDFTAAHGVACLKDRRTLVVAELGKGQVVSVPDAFDGRSLRRKVLADKGTGANQFKFPFGVAALFDGTTVAVTDYGLNRVAFLDGFTGAFLRSFDIVKPYAIGVLEDMKTVVVAQLDNNNVVFLDSVTGSIKSRIGGTGSRPDQFNMPNDISPSGDNHTMWICDRFNRRMVIYDHDSGSTLRVLGGEGSSASDVFRGEAPLALCQLGDGKIAVATDGNQVYVFE